MPQGVNRIIAGSGIAISPSAGTGDVVISTIPQPYYDLLGQSSLAVPTGGTLPNTARRVPVQSQRSGGEEHISLDINNMAGGEEKIVYFLKANPNDVLVFDGSLFNADRSPLNSLKITGQGDFVIFRTRYIPGIGIQWTVIEHSGLVSMDPPLAAYG